MGKWDEDPEYDPDTMHPRGYDVLRDARLDAKATRPDNLIAFMDEDGKVEVRPRS